MADSSDAQEVAEELDALSAIFEDDVELGQDDHGCRTVRCGAFAATLVEGYPSSCGPRLDLGRRCPDALRESIGTAARTS